MWKYTSVEHESSVLNLTFNDLSTTHILRCRFTRFIFLHLQTVMINVASEGCVIRFNQRVFQLTSLSVSSQSNTVHAQQAHIFLKWLKTTKIVKMIVKPMFKYLTFSYIISIIYFYIAEYYRKLEEDVQYSVFLWCVCVCVWKFKL